MKSGSRALTQWISRSFVWAIVLGLVWAVGGPTTALARVDEQHAVTKATLAKLPLSFEANRGQTDSRVDFLARGSGYLVFLAGDEAVLALRQPTGAGHRPGGGSVVRMRLVGATSRPEAEGLEELSGKANYFIGSDRAKWRTNIPTYARVRYRDVYPGIDLVYYGNQRQLEYDFILAPGADPEAIRLAVKGADRLEIDAHGDLVLSTAIEALRFRKPRIYQEIDGIRHAVAGGYVLHPHHVGFQVAAYDTSRPLVIDPELVYSTYLGGSGLDAGYGIAVDATGHAYVTGSTASVDFPTEPNPGAYDPTCGSDGDCNAGLTDVFVTKFDTTGTTLVYSTYLGGNNGDVGNGIAVGAEGNAYVTGETGQDFPTTMGAFQETPLSASPAFVAKLSDDGSQLLYSTFLSGNAGATARGIAVHACNGTPVCVYVTGRAASNDFPTKNAYQGKDDFGGNGDAFLTVLDPSKVGSADLDDQLVYSTFLGGFFHDQGESVAVDPDGNAYVTGDTVSVNPMFLLFPVKNASGLQPEPGGGRDAFVAKIDPSKSADASLVYSTFLGGSSEENGTNRDGGIAVDASGNAYVVGATASSGLPTTPNAFQKDHSGLYDVFVAKIDASPSLVYLSYLGGFGFNNGTHVAVDAFGNAHVIGSTTSSSFPGAGGGVAPKFGGDAPGTGNDVFLAKIDPSKSGPASLVYATYLGGSGGDLAYGVAVDPCGNAYATGETTSAADFPTPNAFDPTFGGSVDAFVVKIGYTVATFCHAPLAYISHATDDIVAVIDTSRHAWTDTLPGGFGIAVHPDGTQAYVANRDGNSVSVIDTATHVLTEAPGVIAPDGVAVHPSGRWVYAVSSNTVSVIDTHTKALVGTVGLPPINSALGVAVHPGGHKVYVTNGPSVYEITVSYSTDPLVSAPTHTLTDEVATAGGSGVGVAVHPDGTKVYVADVPGVVIPPSVELQFGTGVSVINADPFSLDGSIVPTVLVSGEQITLGFGRYGVAVHPDGTKVYLTNEGAPSPIAYPGAGGLLAVMDIAQDTSTTVLLGGETRGVSVTPDGLHVYVANLESSTVSVVDTSTNTEVKKIPVGLHPDALGQFIGPADRDGDGIVDPVDGVFDAGTNVFTDQSTQFSSSFTDRGRPDGTCNAGSIVTRDLDGDGASLIVTVWDAFAPAGLWVRASGGGAGQTAQVEGGGIPIDLTPGDVGLIQACNSLTLQALAGPIEIPLGGGTLVSVPNGALVKVSEVAQGRFLVENQGSATIQIVAQGQAIASLGPGSAGTFPLDGDADGVSDSRDACPGTAPGSRIDANGCSSSQLVGQRCGCTGPVSGGAWKNHGAYVSCVAQATTELAKGGLLTGKEKGAVVSEATRSTCGLH